MLDNARIVGDDSEATNCAPIDRRTLRETRKDPVGSKNFETGYQGIPAIEEISHRSP